ncbi:MAG: M1 family metallopeptidase [Anaerolineae bacterium]|nr:M1 family metallopeptidase [Anaerolineae bacterium]MDK1082224.1 M1 family metallopeptidase [Anaerolineae bacterium]MDK1118423.1 M1 family metallopeptidase [Anaerolineae bacterium]
MPKAIRITAFLCLLISFSSCASPAPVTETLQSSISPTLAPPTETAVLPTDLPTPTPIPVPERAKYTLNTTLDYANKTVNVGQTILYPNHSGETLSNLVLAVAPNMWPGSFNLASLSVDGNPISVYNLSGQRLEFTLPTPLAPETTVAVALQYTLALPFAEQQDPSVERPRIYGFTPRQVNLANWYPFIVPYEAGVGWVLHDPWYYGEHLVYDAADYEVTLKTDPNVVVAASGFGEQSGDSTRYTLTAGRAFAISASPEFLTVSTQVADVTVTSYYFPFYDDPGGAVLAVSAKAVQLFSQRFGPYPHKTLAAVMGDFNDGMEYSAFYFLPRDFYNLYDSTPKNYLTFVAAHETAHQWWFERVANDQAQAPWLDESLSTYSERLYYESFHPELVDWWQPYRMYYFDPAAKMDIPIYEGTGFQPYTNATYFVGAQFLGELRARIGDEAFFAFLRDYVAQLDGMIATPQDFFVILRQHSSADISDLIATYFTNAY